MKRILASLLSVLMLVSVFAAAGSVNADGEVRVRIERAGEESLQQTVTAGNGVSLSMNGNIVKATSTGGTERWISVDLPDIDANIFDTMLINYNASGPIADDGIYLKGTVFNTDYSSTEGTFSAHKLNADGNWNTSGYIIKADFPAMQSYKISGIRIPVCSTANDTFELHSIEFRLLYNDRHGPVSVGQSLRRLVHGFVLHYAGDVRSGFCQIR